ncbi:PspC domain-containing protein [Synechocystis sp. PCC 7509]|uniref:PspC domain-containing protein n=1 Tax=Synechocystis sp. PCC 7509 TaxID=927677 RepID=UPI0002AC0778|nr:PspC domain-containing protein [Synechocystis sp. PCC 7509]
MIFLPLISILLLVGPAIASIAIMRSLSIRWHLFLFVLCIFYAILPLLVAWSGIGLAKRLGCQAEAIVFRCPDPSWHGDLVTRMAFMHWLAIISIPSAVLGAIGLVISLILTVKKSQTTVDIAGKQTAVFYRSRRHKVIAGICAAIAQQWNLPLQGVRIVTVIVAIVFSPSVLLYVWSWLAFPLELPIESH